MSIPALKRRRVGTTLTFLILGLGLAACGAEAPVALGESAAVVTPISEDVESTDGLVQSDQGSNLDKDSQSSLTLPGDTLVDRQGAVEVAVSPLVEPSGQPGRLVFEVAMNTHSVDLSMNLAELAVFETDTGLSLSAATWSGGSGHHVTGFLEFELPQGEEFDQLARAAQWILILRDVDAAERVYIWELG